MKYAIYEKKREDVKVLAEKVRLHLSNYAYDELNPDYVIVIGGDGTFLRAVKKYIDLIDKVKFIVFNAGNLGYYAQFTETDIPYICEILDNEHDIISFNLLEFKINDELINYALNEISIYNYPLVSSYSIFIDNLFLEKFSGNGLCVSTNNGSTGLNKSLNGAIIDWQLPSLQITEIAGLESKLYHSLKNPLILSEKRKILIKNLNNFNKIRSISYDCESRLIKDFKTLEIKMSEKRIKCVALKEKNFINKINDAFNL